MTEGMAIARPALARHRHGGATRAFFVALLLAMGGLAASAQTPQLSFPARPAPVIKPSREGDPQMLVRAARIDYDYSNKRVSAVGNVQIYYQGATLEADRVVYDQGNKRLHSEGNVRLIEPDGRITYGQILDLSDDFRNGFIDSLRIDTPDQTRLAAARASRSGGNFTVFESGVYTACEPCKDDPRKPPLWQVKAARVVHDQGEKMVYFENASLEFFGVPLAYLPYFSNPDPTVKRKTGFLVPVISTSSKYGAALEAPFFWALAPDYDLTLSPMITSQQGLLGKAEWRQRLLNGAYSIRAAGIFQQDKSYFLRDDGTATPGYRNSRGSIETAGQFALSQKWAWGWTGTLLSDKTFLKDYGLLNYTGTTDQLLGSPMETVSQLYLVGRGDRSYFDMRAIHYRGFSEADRQNQLPVIHPVIDYNYKFENPVAGGELGFRTNLTSLSRDSANFDPILTTSFMSGACMTADPAVKTRANCVLRGMPGNYTRFSSEANWQRSLTDSFGQVFTPFASVRADLASVQTTAQPGVSNFMTTGQNNIGRVTPTVGIEYRYPFIAAQSWGTQTIEPIAQVIIRPNESHIGAFPNEDAQSLVFDDTNLFRVDKFAGWDRAEGGSRANVGVQYRAQFNRAGSFNVLFGQSYSLFGQNSFAIRSPTNTGLDSGLETRTSDYVAGVRFQPNAIVSYGSHFRFDEKNFALRRFELETTANLGRWSTTVLYGNYDAQPALGFLSRRQGILGTGKLSVTPNWALLGGARYDIEASRINQTQVGLGYIDECLIFAVNYVTDRSYSGNPHAEHRVMLQIALRTIGGSSVSQAIGGYDTGPSLTPASPGRTAAAELAGPARAPR